LSLRSKRHTRLEVREEHVTGLDRRLSDSHIVKLHLDEWINPRRVSFAGQGVEVVEAQSFDLFINIDDSRCEVVSDISLYWFF